jgi:peroxiredoxin
MKMKTLFTIFTLLMSVVTYAQEVKSFTLPNAKDGNTISLSNYTSSKAIVVVFTSHECPFDNYYKDRLKEMINTYADRVQFLLINSNIEPQESVEQMAIHYTDLSAPYLADKDQLVMTSLGARKTPEVFLILPANGKFMISYAGAIDDNPQVSQAAKQTFLKDAIEKVLSNQKVETPTQRATGCTIRKK